MNKEKSTRTTIESSFDILNYILERAPILRKSMTELKLHKSVTIMLSLMCYSSIIWEDKLV